MSSPIRQRSGKRRSARGAKPADEAQTQTEVELPEAQLAGPRRSARGRKTTEPLPPQQQQQQQPRTKPQKPTLQQQQQQQQENPAAGAEVEVDADEEMRDAQAAAAAKPRGRSAGGRKRAVTVDGVGTTDISAPLKTETVPLPAPVSRRPLRRTRGIAAPAGGEEEAAGAGAAAATDAPDGYGNVIAATAGGAAQEEADGQPQSQQRQQQQQLFDRFACRAKAVAHRGSGDGDGEDVDAEGPTAGGEGAAEAAHGGKKGSGAGRPPKRARDAAGKRPGGSGASSSGPSRDMEVQLQAQGYSAVGGADEAGRGPLAGPVVAAVVVLPPLGDPSWVPPRGLNDSKAISEEEREAVYDKLVNDPRVKWAVSVVDHREIDRINILQAALGAMRRSAVKLMQQHQQQEQGGSSSSSQPPPQPPALDFLLVDGNRMPKDLPVPARTVVKGDATVSCIAAASCIAKVTRDRLMLQLDEQHPQYGFAQHKGYGVPAHMEAIRRHGPSAVHRRSFEPVKSMTGWSREAMLAQLAEVEAERERAQQQVQVQAQGPQVAPAPEEAKGEAGVAADAGGQASANWAKGAGGRSARGRGKRGAAGGGLGGKSSGARRRGRAADEEEDAGEEKEQGAGSEEAVGEEEEAEEEEEGKGPRRKAARVQGGGGGGSGRGRTGLLRAAKGAGGAEKGAAPEIAAAPTSRRGRPRRSGNGV